MKNVRKNLSFRPVSEEVDNTWKKTTSFVKANNTRNGKNKNKGRLSLLQRERKRAWSRQVCLLNVILCASETTAALRLSLW